MGQIVFVVFPCRFRLSLFDRLLEGAHEGGLVGSLEPPIALHNAFCRVGMRPQRNSVGTVERIPHGMIEVIVRVQSTLDGYLANHPESIHLEGSPGHADESLDQQRAVFANQESPIANRLEAFRGIRNRRVQPFTDLSNRCEALIHKRRLGYARVFCHSAANAGIGSSLATPYIAPKYDDLARNVRRENGIGLMASGPRLKTSIIHPPMKSKLDWMTVVEADYSSRSRKIQISRFQ